MSWFTALKLNAEAVEEHEEDIRERVRELPDELRKQYFSQFKREMKDPDTYATLNWFFVAGLHHMYLGDYARGGTTLVAMAISIFLLFTSLMPLAIFIIAAILVVELMALFRSQTVVADHNNQLAEDILADL